MKEKIWGSDISIFERVKMMKKIQTSEPGTRQKSSNGLCKEEPVKYLERGVVMGRHETC